MDLSQVRQECKDILSSESLNPVQKVKGVDKIISELYDTRTNRGVDASPSDNTADTKADPTNEGLHTYGLENHENGEAELLTELANEIRDIVRENAWDGKEPIKLKDALENSNNNTEIFDQNTWDLIENWIDHDRDYNWNYLNLVQFNLKYNKKVDNDNFWLSPQHFRMACIIDTVGREMDPNKGFDLDLAKKIYQNPNQLPQAIKPSLGFIRHTE